MKIEKTRKYREDCQFESAEQHDGRFYEPHKDDPQELRQACPVCVADVGEWCGGFGDIHDERKKK